MRLFTLLTLVLFSIGAAAQSLQLSQNEVSFPVDSGVDYDEITLTNVSDETITVAHRLQVRCHDAVDTSAIQVCFGILCHGPFNEDVVIDQNVTWVTLEPGESTGDIAYHMFYSADQGSDWRVTYYDFFNQSDEVYIDIHAGVCEEDDVIVGVADVDKKGMQLDVFQNYEVIRIQYSGARNGELLLMDLSGQVIRNWKTQSTQGNITLNPEELSSGMYLLQFISPQGQRMTRRVVVN